MDGYRCTGRLMAAALFTAGVLGLHAPAAEKETKEVQPKIVKLDELKKAITDQKGKVVVVDFWADT
jgi:thiol:disulfide interchange protein